MFKPHKLYRIYLFIIVCTTPILAGCFAATPVQTFNQPELLQDMECLAITPFSNTSDNTNAGKIFEHLLFDELAKDPRVKLMDSTESALALSTHSLETMLFNKPNAVRAVANVLRVQGVITGEIRNYSYAPFDNYGTTLATVSYQINLYHLPTGHLVWSYQQQQQSRAAESQRDPLSRVAMFAAQDASTALMKALLKNDKNNRKAANPRLPCGLWVANI